MDAIKEALEHAITLNLPFMVIGETGVGKTTLIQSVAAKKKKTLQRVSINGGIGTEDIVGKYVLQDGSTKWIDGPLIRAMREGSWVVFDELNAAAPEVLFALHGVLDHEKAILLQEKDGELVRAHKDFRFFATTNPTTYAGTRTLNQAFMSRFVVVEQDVLPPEQEIAVIVEQSHVKKEIAAQLVAKADQLRKMKKNREISYFCGTRDLIQAAMLFAEGLSKDKAFCVAVINKLPPADLETLIAATGDYNAYINAFDSGELDKELARLKTLETDIANGNKLLKEVTDQLAKAKAAAETTKQNYAAMEEMTRKELSKLGDDLAKAKADTKAFKQSMLDEIKKGLIIA